MTVFFLTFFKNHYKLAIAYLILMVKEAVIIYFFLQMRLVIKEMDLYAAIWLSLQIIFNAVFGIISDRYCRKITLNLTLVMTIVSILLMKKSLFLGAVIINGIFGNTVGIARAAYCDINTYHKKEINIVDTFIPQTIPYIFLFFNLRIFHFDLFYVVLILVMLALILSVFFFKDFRDKKIKEKKSSVSIVLRKYFKINFIRLFFARFLWGVLWHTILYFGARHLQIFDQQKYIFFAIGFSYLLGTLVTKCFKLTPYYTISLCFCFVFLFFVFNWLLFSFTGYPGELSPGLFLVFTFFMGMSMPLIYSYFALNAKMHQLGTIYGFLETATSINAFLGPIVLNVIMPVTNLTFILFVPFLALAFLLSIKLPPVKQVEEIVEA